MNKKERAEKLRIELERLDKEIAEEEELEAAREGELIKICKDLQAILVARSIGIPQDLQDRCNKWTTRTRSTEVGEVRLSRRAFP